MNEVIVAGSTSAIDRPRNVTGVFSRLRYGYQTHQMKTDLSRWFGAAKDFKANGLPPGSPAYQQLYAQSCQRVTEHAKTWGMRPDSIIVEMPGLYSLQKLANPEPAARKAGVLASAIGIITLLFVLAAVFGGMSGVFQLAQRLVLR